LKEVGRKAIPLYHVDAFTKEPFKGNPAAVCILEQPYEDSMLQSIAAEMNLSETAFLQKPEKKPMRNQRSFGLRWFTPKTEVNLCGHATLATATVLFCDLEFPSTEASFQTRSGKLTAKLEHNRILLDFPSSETVPFRPSRALLEAVGVSDFESAHISRKTKDLLIVLDNEANVKNLKPEFERMRSIKTADNIDGVIVTSKGHAQYDFISRFFAPWLGINEDPVTGAAHTVLGPYWSRILGKTEMQAYQASRRGGELTVRILSPDRVGLVGDAVIISKGELYLKKQ
jgi:PhzF family phenazine biosynthesis protein